MINRLRRKVTSNKLQSGGMPAPFEQAPLFSQQGLRQRAEQARGLYNRLPGAVRGPLNFAGRVVLPKTPIGRGIVYGGAALGAMGGIEGLRKALNPTEETIVNRINAANPVNERQLIIGKDISVFGKGLGPSLLPDDSNIVTKEKRTIDDDFPGMTSSEIIETIEKQGDNTGVEIKPEAIIETINNANKQNQMLAPDKVLTNINEEEGRPSQDIIEQQTVEAQKGPEGDGIIVDDKTINDEYTSRDEQEHKANQLFIDEYFGLGGDKSLLALSLDKTVGDLMGDDNKKSRKLLLLQLAAGLLSNKTTEGGFRGFLDVLGQSGQQVIPLALSLEAQRRDDEIELKKALLANMKKKEGEASKWSLPNKLAKFKMPGQSEITTARIRSDQFGNIEAMLTDRDGRKPRYVDITTVGDIQILEAPDKDDILATNNRIGLKTRALKGVREALEISVKDPSLIGSPGTIQRTAAIAGDILESYLGKSKFSDLRTELEASKEQFLVEQKMRLDDGEISEEDYNEAIKSADNFFNKGLDQIKKGLAEGEGTDLQLQAKLRTIELLTSYALANILKDKDRLAVRDIERAEKLTNQFGLLTSPTDVISRYLVLEQQLVNSIQNDIKIAENIGILPGDIIDYNEAATLTNFESDKKNAEFRTNLEAIIGSDPELLNKFIDQLGFDKLKVIE